MLYNSDSQQEPGGPLDGHTSFEEAPKVDTVSGGHCCLVRGHIKKTGTLNVIEQVLSTKLTN